MARHTQTYTQNTHLSVSLSLLKKKNSKPISTMITVFYVCGTLKIDFASTFAIWFAIWMPHFCCYNNNNNKNSTNKNNDVQTPERKNSQSKYTAHWCWCKFIIRKMICFSLPGLYGHKQLCIYCNFPCVRSCYVVYRSAAATVADAATVPCTYKHIICAYHDDDFFCVPRSFVLFSFWLTKWIYIKILIQFVKSF